MCGRTCCTLGPDLVPYACTIVTKDRKLPQWKEAPCGGHYEPSTNVPPTAYTPVLYTTDEVKHSQKQDAEDDVLSKAFYDIYFLKNGMFSQKMHHPSDLKARLAKNIS